MTTPANQFGGAPHTTTERPNFFREELHAATPEECAARWSCGKPGERFRCCFCGHKFAVGDLFRIVYTNDMPNAGGNPLVCKDCDAATSVLRERWRDKIAAFTAIVNAPENWALLRRVPKWD